MSNYNYIDNCGTFELEGANFNNYLYFPLCNEAGMMSSVTPTLGGDAKLDQNTFILPPVSVEDLHNNKSTRNFWLKFADGGLRSATGVSCIQRAERCSTTVRAGLLWHQAVNHIEYGGTKLTSKVTSFVPADRSTVEVMSVNIANKGETEISFTPIAAIPLYGRSATNQRDHRHVTSLLHRIYTTEDGVHIRPTLTFDERGHKHSTMEYFTVGCDEFGRRPVGFYPTVESFIGEGGDFEMPLGLDDEAVGANECFEGLEAMGGLKFADCTLKAGESVEFEIFIGAHERTEEYSAPAAVINRVIDVPKAAVAEMLRNVEEFWQQKLKFRVVTGDANFDNYMLWVAAQPILRRIMGCSFLPYHDYGRGGRGWRDLWQDCLALILNDPADVRELLVNNFAGVRADGTNATIIGTKPGEFLADRNNIVRVWMDHGLWPYITTEFYIRQTGDMKLLKEEQVYFKDKQCMRAREIDSEIEQDSEANSSTRTQLKDARGNIYRGSLLEHLLLMHIAQAGDLGDHGHMLLRGADWNDALDMAADKGESVAFTAAYAGNLKSMSKLVKDMSAELGDKIELLGELVTMIRRMASEEGQATVSRKEIVNDFCKLVRHTVSGDKVEISLSELADMLDVIGERIMKHIRETELINEAGSDCIWYNGYYDNNGERVESFEAGRLMLTSAVFTIMSGTATDEQLDGMIKTADKYLFDEGIGGYKLNTRFANEIDYATKFGRAYGFAYGTKENGAVFSHMAVMYGFALMKRGRKEAASKVINALCAQSANFEKSHMYPGIPEYFSPSGRGMYTYLTGAASWMLLYFSLNK